MTINTECSETYIYVHSLHAYTHMYILIHCIFTMHTHTYMTMALHDVIEDVEKKKERKKKNKERKTLEAMEK